MIHNCGRRQLLPLKSHQRLQSLLHLSSRMEISMYVMMLRHVGTPSNSCQVTESPGLVDQAAKVSSLRLINQLILH